jgi:hypothetical protein
MALAAGIRASTAGLVLVLLAGLLLRVTAIDSPPLDSHHVRQSDTSSMARVMMREGSDLLNPRIDWAGPEAGPVESEFPLYQALVAEGWRRLGSPVGTTYSPSAAWARGISVIAWLLGALALAAWVRRRVGGPVWPCLLLFALSPLSVVFSRNIQPDSLAVALLLIGLERLDAASSRPDKGAPAWAVVAGVLLGTAVAVKGTMAFWFLAAVPMAFAPRGQRATRRTRWLALGVGLTIATALGAAWYLHAASLGVDGASFGIWGSDAHKWGGARVWLRLSAWVGIFGTLLAATWTPVGTVLVGAGFVASRSRPVLAPFAWGVGALAVAMVAVTEGFDLHSYYQLPVVPFASVLAGWALREVWHTVRDAPRVPWLGPFLGALGVAAIVSTLILGRGFVVENLRLDRRPALIAGTAGSVIPEGSPVVVVDRHPQTVLYAMDRRGWTRDTIDVEDLEWLEVDGAEYLLVSDTSASYWSQEFRAGVAAHWPLVAQGPDWVLFRLYGGPDYVKSPGGSPPEPGSPTPPP